MTQENHRHWNGELAPGSSTTFGFVEHDRSRRGRGGDAEQYVGSCLLVASGAVGRPGGRVVVVGLGRPVRCTIKLRTPPLAGLAELLDPKRLLAIARPRNDVDGLEPEGSNETPQDA